MQNKTIPFSDIKKVCYGQLNKSGKDNIIEKMVRGKWAYWYSGDNHRYNNTHYIAIDILSDKDTYKKYT